MKALAIKNIGLLATPADCQSKCGDQQAGLLKIKNAGLVAQGGVIKFIGSDSDPEFLSICDDADVLDAKGRVVTPGLVDAHTHLVFGGWRAHEASQKLAGATYMQILQSGGGILSTVKETRAASERELLAKGKRFLDEMMMGGVTSCEAKSGYGLDVETELKQLRVIGALNDEHPMTVVGTFMGAHATPPEFAGNAEGYIEHICEKMLPAVAEQGIAQYCDAFCEDGVFDVSQCERVLKCARSLGLKSKLHADEILPIGGSQLAARLGAASAEHLISAPDESITLLAQAGVTAVLLPATSFYLGKGYARARQMINGGVPVALASDFNPGSCPSSSLQLVMNLAFLQYKMSIEEIITAVTVNAANAIGLKNTGCLQPQNRADIVIWDADTLEMLCYRFGTNQAHTVIKAGRIVATA